LKTPTGEEEVEDKADPLGGQIAIGLARVLKLRRAQLTVTDKVGFLAYFNDNKKGYSKAEKDK